MNKSTIDISIIIVSWNTKKITLECIGSIIDTITDLSYEIIVVDNNSFDGSVDAITAQFPKVKIITNKKNEGFAKANNKGLQVCSGSYISLINSDVKLLPNCLNLLFEFMEESKNKNVGIIGPRILNKDMSYQMSTRQFPSLFTAIVETFGLHSLGKIMPFLQGEFRNLNKCVEPIEVDILSGCFWFVKRQALDLVGGLDEQFYFYGEDRDFCYRFLQLHWRVLYYPQASAIHYGGASSALKPFRFYIQLQRAHIQFWKKHYLFVRWFPLYMLKCLFFIIRIPFFLLASFIMPNKRDILIQRFKLMFGALIWCLTGKIVF